MSALRHWSSKYITRAVGDSLWVRADHVDRMRDSILAGGRVETGESVVTGGKRYVEFLLDDDAPTYCACCLSNPCACQYAIDQGAA